MAGQPQDNSWSQQGNGYSQGTPGYEPAYEQQPGSYDQQGTYQQGQVYEQQQQTYGQPQSYEQPTVYDQAAPSYNPSAQQAYAQPPQGYPGQTQQGQPQPGWEQWQLPQRQAPRPAKPAKQARTERGFIASLFDFGFTSFVTPKIIKALYALATVWTVVLALAYFALAKKTGGMGAGLAVLIIVDPIFVLLSLGAFRVLLEFFMILFRMREDLTALRERSAERAARSGDGGQSQDGA